MCKARERSTYCPYVFVLPFLGSTQQGVSKRSPTDYPCLDSIRQLCGFVWTCWGEKNHTQHFMVEETNNDVLSFTNGHRLSVNHRFFETAKDRDHLQKRTSMDFLGFPWFSFFPWLDPTEFPYAPWSKHIKTWHENRVWPSHHHGMTIIVHVIMSQWLSCFMFYIVLP